MGVNPANPLRPDFAISAEFWRNKRIFVTGHTGFKGSWLLVWLAELGARVRGYALPPDTTPSMFEALRLDTLADHLIGDVRDESRLRAALREFQPEIVIHMAAQPLVRRSYRQPLETFATNAQGTVNLLDACRDLAGLRAMVVVTTDKCYENRGPGRGYQEQDRLGGRDPYSASKACAELVTASYRDSFFGSGGTAVATARAGNVFGGGDWSEDRLIPDAVRAFSRGEPLGVRNPSSVRPWQHVIEPLAGYLTLARALCERGHQFATAYNFGPHPDHALSTSGVAEAFARCWGGGAGWVHRPQPASLHEAPLLLLDSSRADAKLGWSPKTDLREALQHTANWYRSFYENAPAESLLRMTAEQIAALSQERAPAL